MNEDTLLWTIPVPVKTSRFTSLHRRHRPYNVEVDLTRISTFSPLGSNEIAANDLLHCDLQSNADTNLYRRLGSGRAGLYRGAYLKGVGKTLLAGNWRRDQDLYHNSGLLFPSGAVREYLISEFLRVQGKSHLVNACEGILLAPLPAKFRNHQRKAFEYSAGELKAAGRAFPECDARLQAISVKRGDFARMSNFAWWLSNFPQLDSRHTDSIVALFFERFAEALAGPGAHARRMADPDGEGIADLFAETIVRTTERLLEAWSLGLRWGSFHNNFTLDGRFLDLETPTLLSRPNLAIAMNAFKSTPKARIEMNEYHHLSGFEVVLYLRQAQLFASFLTSRLEWLIANRLLKPGESAFARAFVDRLARRLRKDHPLGSFDALAELVVPAMAKRLALTPKERRTVESMLRYASRILFRKPGETVKSAPMTVFYKLESEPLAPSEPHVHFMNYVPGFLRERRSPDSELNLHFNRTLIAADALEDDSEIFALLKRATREMGIASRRVSS